MDYLKKEKFSLRNWLNDDDEVQLINLCFTL
jgi:hypothetical protein